MSHLRIFVKGGLQEAWIHAIGRRERAKRDKRERISGAASELFTRHGVSGVTTQQIADRADAAIGKLHLYASMKAELLIMAQNAKSTHLRLKQPPRRMAFAHPPCRAALRAPP